MAFWDPADLIGTLRAVEADEDCRSGEGVVEINGKLFAVAGITSPAHIAGLPENVRRAVVGWGWDKKQNFTLKLANKSKALDQFARHLSLYNDRFEVSSVEALGDRMHGPNLACSPLCPPFHQFRRHRPRALSQSRTLRRQGITTVIVTTPLMTILLIGLPARSVKPMPHRPRRRHH